MGILDGKVAIVTGATSGIGEKIAEVFVAQGATVIAAGRRQVEGEALQNRLGLTFIRADVSNDADVAALFQQTSARHGRLDCLVNNAGISAKPSSLAEIDFEDFDKVMAVNIRGLVICMKHAAAAMLPQRSGSIVNISSQAGTRGGLAGYAYAASKGAVLAVTRSAAVELGASGIRANAISPGAIVTGIFGKTAGVEGAKADKVTGVVREIFQGLQPLNRAGESVDVANAAAFLASDWGSFVNGHDLLVDGGSTINLMHWDEGWALRKQLRDAIEAAAALI